MPCPARSADLDELRVKRQELFEFTAKPTVARDGDRVTIGFASKAFCDAAVAIEDGAGATIRHLAAGVLGPNAPEPFQKDSLTQAVVWDGKNDKGEYVEGKERLTAAVSLGLAPRFAKTLFHSPYKRIGRNSPVMAAAPEGVYVYEGDNLDSVRLFDHEGNYVRTVYPFPGDKLDKVKGLRWRQAAGDGPRVPFKEGFYQTTFFDSGYNSGYNQATGFGVTHFPTIGMYWAEDAPDFPAATAFAVSNGRIALAGVLGVNRMATDGSSGEMELIGPRSSVTAVDRIRDAAATPVRLPPRSAALSPDGKWLYLTGYTWRDEFHHYGGRRWLHGVLRVKFDGQGEPEPFVGSAKPDPAQAGNGPDKLYSPVALTCDGEGNVYVADYGNNRVQVFTPEGKLKESIDVSRPAGVAVHQKTGELYVFSWLIKWDATMEAAADKAKAVDAVLTRLGPPGDRRKIASYPLPFNGYSSKFAMYFEIGGIQYRAALDSWADPPTVWLVPGASVTSGNYGVKSYFWPQTAIKVLTVEKDKLTLKRDFGAETLKATARDAPAPNSGQYLTVNPRTGKLFLMEGRVAADQVVQIDPETGKEQLVDLPHTADEICFDMDGLAYLRTGNLVTRYDPSEWREVPWDYGEERKGVGGGHGRSTTVMAGLVLPGAHPCEPSETHCGGFGVSPRGNLAVECWNGEAFSAGRDRREEKGLAQVAQRYTPKVYPGRQRWGEIHIWDRHGKLVCQDATPGVTITDGVSIDKDDNLYVLTNPARTPDGRAVLNPKTETLIKFKPGKGRVITSGDKEIVANEGVRVPVLLKKGQEPDGPTQIAGAHQPAAWVQGAEWLYGGVGFASGGDTCWNARCALDLFGRSFAPEPDRFSVAVLDSNGNLILRVGRYGNVDDGSPTDPRGGPAKTQAIGGDEVALMHACYVGADAGRRLFIADAGNRRILSVKLDYHATERVVIGGNKGN